TFSRFAGLGILDGVGCWPETPFSLAYPLRCEVFRGRERMFGMRGDDREAALCSCADPGCSRDVYRPECIVGYWDWSYTGGNSTVTIRGDGTMTDGQKSG